MSCVIPHCPHLALRVHLSEMSRIHDSFDDVTESASHDQIVTHLTSNITEIEVSSLKVFEINSNCEALERFANGLKKVRCVSFRLESDAKQALRAFFATSKPTIETFRFYLREARSHPDGNLIWRMKKAMPDLQNLILHGLKSEGVKLYCTLLTGCSNLRRVEVFGYSDIHLRGRIAERYFLSRDRKTAVGCCNRLLLAMRDLKKLELVSITHQDNRTLKSGGKFMNKIEAAQLSRFRPVRIIIFGIKMFTPAARAARFLYKAPPSRT